MLTCHTDHGSIRSIGYLIPKAYKIMNIRINLFSIKHIPPTIPSIEGELVLKKGACLINVYAQTL